MVAGHGGEEDQERREGQRHVVGGRGLNLLFHVLPTILERFQ